MAATQYSFMPEPRRTRVPSGSLGTIIVVLVMVTALTGLVLFRMDNPLPGWESRLGDFIAWLTQASQAVFRPGPPEPSPEQPGPEDEWDKKFYFDATTGRTWRRVEVPLEKHTPRDLATYRQEKRSNRVEVRGIYLPAPIAGDPDWFRRVLDLVEQTELNALVIDVKNDSGLVTYDTTLAEVEALGVERKFIRDLRGMLKELNDAGIYTIARLVVFKDSPLASARPDLAIKTRAGGVWRDNRGTGWANPLKQEVWDYNLAIAREVVRMGFREVQFDYVRFPSDGNTDNAVYEGQDERTKAQVIGDFLNYASQLLVPLGAFVSADVFGQVPSVPDDMGIGQQWEELVGEIDYISPMVYPSHYATRVYGLADPDAAPYETVFASLTDAVKRTRPEQATIRPWLQSFSLQNMYGAAEVRAQIKATYDAGLREWLLWNPGASYISASLEPSPRSE